MYEDLAPPSSAAWDSKRRIRRRWNIASAAFSLALMSVSGLYWVKNPPEGFASSFQPQSAAAATLER